MSHDNHPSSNSSQNPPSTWTEPPWSGWIETTGDALLILEAARRGLIPRVTRRLVDSERKMITSGSVFVFDEDESGIKRWTDGFFWSPSRILGNFLLYRETEKRGAGHRSARAEREVTTEEQYNPDGVKLEGGPGNSLSRPKSEASRLGIDRARERTLVGSLTNSYKFKPGGMMKKTFSLTIGGVAQHLISYYKVDDVEQGRLRSPSSLPELASLEISPEYLDKTHFRNPPKVEIGVDGIPRYRGEADDVDPPHVMTPPLAITYGDNEASTSSVKRAKSARYDPYSPTATSKPRRKAKNPSSTNNGDTDTEPASPTYPSTVHQPAPIYTDAHSLSATTNYAAAPYSYYPSYPAGYSPSSYPAPVSPVQPPQQSPTPPQHPSPTTHTPITYSGYSPDSHPPSQSAVVYPYYPPPTGYTGYGVWPPPYSGYSSQSQHASHSGSAGGSSNQERSARDGRDDGDDGT